MVVFFCQRDIHCRVNLWSYPPSLYLDEAFFRRKKKKKKKSAWSQVIAVQATRLDWSLWTSESGWGDLCMKSDLEIDERVQVAYSWFQTFREFVTQGTQTLYINKNKCTVIYLCFCVFLSRLEGIWMKRRRFTLLNIYLVGRLCKYDAPITSQVPINAVNYGWFAVSRNQK